MRGGGWCARGTKKPRGCFVKCSAEEGTERTLEAPSWLAQKRVVTLDAPFNGALPAREFFEVYRGAVTWSGD